MHVQVLKGEVSQYLQFPLHDTEEKKKNNDKMLTVTEFRMLRMRMLMAFFFFSFSVHLNIFKKVKQKNLMAAILQL